MSAVMVLLEAEVVALLAEGVDRNPAVMDWQKRREMSPSSRRAWIEIFPEKQGFYLR